jgi:hypothetical protein
VRRGLRGAAKRQIGESRLSIDQDEGLFTNNAYTRRRHIGHPMSASLITSYACFSFLCRVARELTQGSAERNQFCRRGTKSRRWRKIPTRTM